MWNNKPNSVLLHKQTSPEFTSVKGTSAGKFGKTFRELNAVSTSLYIWGLNTVPSTFILIHAHKNNSLVEEFFNFSFITTIEIKKKAALFVCIGELLRGNSPGSR